MSVFGTEVAVDYSCGLLFRLCGVCCIGRSKLGDHTAFQSCSKSSPSGLFWNALVWLSGRVTMLGRGLVEGLVPSRLLSSSWQRLTLGSSSPCPRCCPWASPTKVAGSPGSCRPRTMTLGRRWTPSSIRSTRCDGFCPRSRPPSCLLVVLS